MAELVISNLPSKTAESKRNLHKTYIEFSPFSEKKLHFYDNCLNFSVLMTLFISCCSIKYAHDTISFR